MMWLIGGQPGGIFFMDYSGSACDSAKLSNFIGRPKPDSLSIRSRQFPIAAEAEMGNKDRLLPMASEFAQFLDRMKTQRGYVFNPFRLRETADQPGHKFVSRTIIKFGESAALKVVDRANKSLWASAHDLGWAFGFRRSQRMMLADLKDLMHREHIATTERF